MLKRVDRKPIPSLDGLRNVQRMHQIRNPKIGEIKTEDVIDARIMRKLDEFGFNRPGLSGTGCEFEVGWVGYRAMRKK